MSVVSNASPLINLAWIGKLDLLRRLYGELFIPEAVWHEVVIEGTGQPGANEVKLPHGSRHNRSPTHHWYMPCGKNWMQENLKPLF